MSESASGQITLIGTSGTAPNVVYSYSLSLTNTGTTPIGTFWFGWAASNENLLPSVPTQNGSPPDWFPTITGAHNATDGSGIQWVANPSAAYLAPGLSLTTFQFLTPDSPSVLAGSSPTHAGQSILTAVVYSAGPLSDAGYQLAIAPPSNATSALTLMSSSNPASDFQNVMFTATVSGSSQAPTGSVNFYDDGNLIGTSQIGNASAATLTVTTLPDGMDTITASYGGDSFYAPSNAAALIETVTPADQTSTTTTLNASQSNLTPGQNLTLTATVMGQNVSPTGTVTFYDGGTMVGSASVQANVATFLVTTLPNGMGSLTATYSGDPNNAPSTSNAVSVSVTLNSTSTSISSSASSTFSGANVTLTASIAGAEGSIAPTGTVTFMNGATAIGTASVSGGQALLTTTSLPIGSDNITAIYSGDSYYAGSTSPIVQENVYGSGSPAPSSVELTTSSPIVDLGQLLTLTALLTSPAVSGPAQTGTVTFSTGSQVLATIALKNGVAVFSTSTLPQGKYDITASYSGDSNYQAGASPSLSEQVIVPGTGLDSTTLTSTPNPSQPGVNVTFTATVNAAGPTPTGLIDFTIDGSPAGYGYLQGTSATYSTPALTLGNHSVVATYVGDSTYEASSSAALTQAIQEPVPTTGLIPTIVRSTVAKSLVQGFAARGAVVIRLVNALTNAVTGKIAVQLYASPNGVVNSGATLIGQMVRRVGKFKPGRFFNVTLRGRAIGLLAANNYTLVAESVDPSMSHLIGPDGPSIELAAAYISLSDAITHVTLSKTLIAGEKTTSSVLIALNENGNIVTPGKTTVAVYLSKNGVLDNNAILVQEASRPIRIAPGKTGRVQAPLKQFPAVAPGKYYLIAKITDADNNVTTATSSTLLTITG